MFGDGDVHGQAAGTPAVLRPTAIGDDELWDLIESDVRERREAAVSVVSTRDIDRDYLDTSWAMCRDADSVRIAARWITTYTDRS